jgi:hypothetical protein
MFYNSVLRFGKARSWMESQIVSVPSHGTLSGRRLPDRRVFRRNKVAGCATVGRWDTFLWLGHLQKHSVLHKLQQCPLSYWDWSASLQDAGIKEKCSWRQTTRVLPNHLCVCGCDTSGSSTRWRAWKQPNESARRAAVNMAGRVFGWWIRETRLGVEDTSHIE